MVNAYAVVPAWAKATDPLVARGKKKTPRSQGSRGYLMWRWGELNPRPLLWSCAFYGCSQLSRFLSPGTCRWHLLRRAQYQLESLCALMLNAEASLLADARIRVEDSSRSDGLFRWRRGTYAARAKSALAETVLLLLALIFLHGSFTR